VAVAVIANDPAAFDVALVDRRSRPTDHDGRSDLLRRSRSEVGALS